MKHLEKELKTISATLILLVISGIIPCVAQSEEIPVYAVNDTVGLNYDPMDSIEVSLLTCSPHEEIYSLYGHSAIRWHNLRQQGPGAGAEDWVFNWGMFNFNKPYFVLRFVFGLTDYELGAYPYDLFWPYYKQCGSSVMEQVLNLTNDEKRRLKDILDENLEPENKVYRYNYFYDNCSTRPRDIIEKCINGKVEYAVREDYTPTYRDMVHECVRNHPWAAFGNDMLLGIKADLKTNLREQEFLPENLMYDFERAQIYVNGEYRPLMKEHRMLVPPGVQIIEQDFPLSPRLCGIIIFAFGLILFMIEQRKQCAFVTWEVLLMVVTGIIGIVLTLMIFSQHPTVSLNLQFLLFNPLPWFFLWPVIKGKETRYWHVTIVLCICFFIGSLFQSYAEGIWSLALCLLLQCILHLTHKREK